MKNIEQLLDEVIGKEGGYSNDPKDAGGETIWGITKDTAISFGYSGDMKLMTKDQAKNIYKQRYWEQPKFDQVANIAPDVAAELFDTGINCGVGTASKFLQRSLNVLNNEGKIFSDMTVDGSIGAMTLTALSKYMAARGTIGSMVLLRMLNSLQCVRYIEIAEGKPSQESFIFGWVSNRVGV